MSLFNSPFNPVKHNTIQTGQQNISSIDAKLSRTNYYDGRLLKASDLIRDQLYLDERLREVGRVLGQGIVRGLQLSLSEDSILEVSPGLAVAPSGRVLELESTTLSLNLLDSAVIAGMNEGFRYLQRGLYAVVLRYAEEGRGSAEVYPRDLQGERGFHFNAFAEGVEIVLTPLNNRLPSSRQHNYHRLNNSVLSRSALVRELILAHREQPTDIDEDGVALGLIAVEHGQPIWLDHGLVRRPHRQPMAQHSLQTDLFYHYEELLQDVLTLRNQSVRGNAFPASHYFEVLPPFGTLPKDCVDPINGYQSYFPDQFEVSISPIRQDDLDAIVQQSLPLEPIDFNKDKDVDIMILVPMDDSQFAFRARQLQHVTVNNDLQEFVLPAHLDEYQLRAYGQSSVHEENTDASVWQDIWATAENVYFVRRPTRVAETQVSAIVLATGDYEDIAHITTMPPDMADLATQIEQLEQQNSELQDQNTQLQQQLDDAENSNSEELDALKKEIAGQAKIIAELRQQLEQQPGTSLSFEQILKLRPSNDERAVDAIKKLREMVNEDSENLSGLLSQLLLLMPAQYDALNWPTLAEVAAEKMLEKLLQALLEATGKNFLETMVSLAGDLPMSDETNKGWQALLTAANATGGTTLVTRDTLPIDLSRVEVLPLDRLVSLNAVRLATTDLDTLKSASDQDPELLAIINQLNTIVDAPYRQALWSSLATLVKNSNVAEFLRFIIAAKQKSLPLGIAVGASNTTFKLTAAQRQIWSNVDLQG